MAVILNHWRLKSQPGLVDKSFEKKSFSAENQPTFKIPSLFIFQLIAHWAVLRTVPTNKEVFLCGL